MSGFIGGTHSPSVLVLTNYVAYGSRTFNAALARTLQLSLPQSIQLLVLIHIFFRFTTESTPPFSILALCPDYLNLYIFYQLS